MSYQEKRSIVNIISTLLITGGYSAYALPQYPQAEAYSETIFHFWGSFFFILIGVSIVASIIITILFSILNTVTNGEGEPSLTDERDHVISLRAARNSSYVFISGVLLAMGSLVISQPPTVMFIILILSGVASSLISDMSAFFFYRRGY